GEDLSTGGEERACGRELPTGMRSRIGARVRRAAREGRALRRPRASVQGSSRCPPTSWSRLLTDQRLPTPTFSTPPDQDTERVGTLRSKRLENRLMPASITDPVR